jgi:hypothetical protein
MTESVISVAPMAMRETGDPIPRMVPPEGLRQMKLWRGEEFTFADLIDFVNPLQHIPIISTIYSHITGESPGALARFTIGGLIGGPIGLLSAAVNSALITETGRDMGQIAIATITGDGPSGSSPVSNEPGALMTQVSDRGSDYAFDRIAPEATETAGPTSVVAYNAGDSMPGTYTGMSDRSSEPYWDRIPTSNSVKSIAGTPVNTGEPAIARQTAPTAGRDAATKVASAELSPPGANPRNTLHAASVARKGSPQGPQLSAQQMAAHLSSTPGVSSQSVVSNAIRQDANQRVAGRPLGVALPATSSSPFSKSMMEALEKYEALAKSRSEAATQVNTQD